MKKNILLSLIILGLVACSNESSIKNESEETSAIIETSIEESETLQTYSKPSVETVNKVTESENSFNPNIKFVYTGNNKNIKAITDEMVNAASLMYGDQEAVEIPTPFIVKVDDDDRNDIKVYGDFWIDGYQMEGTIFNTKNGGSMPGCYHLNDGDNGIVFASKEIAEDGSNNWSSLVRICGGDENLAKEVINARENDSLRYEYAKMYAKENVLKLSGIKDYGWPIILFDEISDAEFVYNFYLSYFDEVRQEDYLSDVVERLTALKAKYMVKELITKLSNMTVDMGADMVIHAQDVTDKMVDSLQVDDLGDGIIMVNYDNGNDGLVQLKVTLEKTNGKRMIANIE